MSIYRVNYWGAKNSQNAVFTKIRIKVNKYGYLLFNWSCTIFLFKSNLS